MEVLRKLCFVTLVSLFFLVSYNTVSSSKIRGIGDDCTYNQTCSDAVIDSFCSSNVCKCEFDIISEDKSRCLVRIGGPCQETVQCARGQEDGSSECLPESNICECTSSYTNSANLTTCLKIVNDLNVTPCEEDGQCRYGKPGELSNCGVALTDDTKRCHCNKNAVDGPSNLEDPSNRNKCYLVAERVGDPCMINTQCTVKLMHGQCQNGVCKCADGYVSLPNSSECLPMRFLDESCKDPVQCLHIENSTCSKKNSNDPTGLCKCSADYTVPPGRNDLCLKNARQIGDPCSHEVQCAMVSNSICKEEKCDCPKEYVINPVAPGCLPKVPGLNGTCLVDGQCQVANSSCLSKDNIKRCSCKANEFVESWDNGGRCVEIVHERNKPCQEEVQCIAGLGELSTCLDDVCQCRFNYGYYNGKCYIPAKLNELCREAEQCYVGVNNLTFCSTTPEDKQKRCRCLPGTTSFQNKCYNPYKKVGDSCDSHEECTVSIIGTAYCDSISKSCACQLGYTPTASNTVCTSGASNVHQYFSFIVTVLIVFAFETTF